MTRIPQIDPQLSDHVQNKILSSFRDMVAEKQKWQARGRENET